MLLHANGNEIKRRRERLGLTRYALSMKAGLGPMALTRMEEELHMVHPLRAKAVAYVLGCDVDEIFHGSTETSYSKASSM